MDRRDFLKTTGMGAAALGLAACTSGKTSGQTEGVKDLSGKMLQNYPGIGTLGYGCMRWPTKDGHIDQDEVNRLVDCALEHGVNYFDTSPVYTRGESETATSIAYGAFALSHKGGVTAW